MAKVCAAGHRGHPLRASAGPQLRAEAARVHQGPRSRDPARRHSRPQEHPRERRRLLRAGRQISHGRVGAYERGDREGRRRRARDRLRAAFPRRTASRHRGRHAYGRRRRDLCARRRAGRRRHGARNRNDRAGRHAGRARQRLCRRGQAPALRPRRHRPFRRPDRNARHRRRHGRRRDLRDRSSRTGGARPHLARDSPDHFGEARAGHDERSEAAAGDPADRRDRGPGVGRLTAKSSSATTRPR